MVHDQFQMPADYRTFQQAAREKGVNYHALRMYIYKHQIPYVKLGYQNLVRMSDLVGYVPMGQRQLDPA